MMQEMSGWIEYRVPYIHLLRLPIAEVYKLMSDVQHHARKVLRLDPCAKLEIIHEPGFSLDGLRGVQKIYIRGI